MNLTFGCHIKILIFLTGPLFLCMIKNLVIKLKHFEFSSLDIFPEKSVIIL